LSRTSALLESGRVDALGEPTQLHWAPHRPLIAFRRRNAAFVIDVPKRVARRVAPGVGGEPSWSPDGRRLVFANGGPRLYIIGADGKGGHYVTPRSWSGSRTLQYR
jgi:hypothetical protein